jgi:FMN phosphatase YigB (HAD superfamily)
MYKLIYEDKRLILSDVDGILLDWTTHFHKYMSNLGYEKRPGPLTYRQEANYPQLKDYKVREIISYFNSSAWLLGLKPYMDARSGVARLLEHGYKFHAITAMGNEDDWALKARKINLAQVFGQDAFVEVTATSMYDVDSKREALSEYKDTGLPWIEDNWENYKLGVELGLNAILMNHPHNNQQNYKNTQRVNNWSEICNLLLN